VLTGDGGIAGFIGQIPTRMRVAGREVLAAQGADVGILQAHRRLDAFLTMLQVCVTELEAAGVALAYGTANAEAALSLGTLLGQETVAPVPLLVRPIGGRSGRNVSTPARILGPVFARRTAARRRVRLPSMPA